MEKSPNLREDNLSEETKTLLSSLPSDKDYVGKLYNYQGCWYHRNVLQGVLDFQKKFTPQDTDIIITSFPKSGTTWLMALTIALLERSKYRSSPDHDHHPLLSNNPHSLVSALEFDLKSSKSFSSSSSSSPRLFSAHMPFHILQEGLKDSPCKIVYICRNVKDVFVSLWHFLNSNREVDWSSETEIVKGADNYTFEVMFMSFCSGVGLYGPYWEHVLSYWRESLKDPNHVLFLRYEELKTEPHAQVKRLAEFLDCPFTKEEEATGSVDKILQLCSLGNLSNLEINRTGKTDFGVGFNTFFRKGEIGDFKNHLTNEMENKIDMIVEEKLKGSGLKF